MGILDWLLTRKSITSVNKPVTEISIHQSTPTEKDVFKSPTLLAKWVNKCVLEGMPLDGYYSMLPGEDARKSFNMTYEQRERYVREVVVLRMAGISHYIKDHYDDDFWVRYSSEVYPYLTAYLYPDENLKEKVAEVAGAVEEYVAASSQKDSDRMSSLYMLRVYDDSDHYLKLKMGGVGFLSVQWLVDSYVVFRDTHCKVVTGMPYDIFAKITAANEEIKIGGESDSSGTNSPDER